MLVLVLGREKEKRGEGRNTRRGKEEDRKVGKESNVK